MATCYFAKSLVGNRIYDSKGQQIKFTIYPQDTGLLMLDSEKDAALVADLRGFIAKRCGGVTEMTLAEYDETKKKLESELSKPKPPAKPLYRLADPFGNPFQAVSNAHAAGEQGAAGLAAGQSLAPSAMEGALPDPKPALPKIGGGGRKIRVKTISATGGK